MRLSVLRVYLILFASCICSKSNERDIVVYTSPQRCKEIVVHTNSTDKVSSKTYTFDRVFGQDTDQEQVYNDIVQPILEEVLMGLVIIAKAPAHFDITTYALLKGLCNSDIIVQYLLMDKPELAKRKYKFSY